MLAREWRRTGRGRVPSWCRKSGTCGSSRMTELFLSPTCGRLGREDEGTLICWARMRVSLETFFHASARKSRMGERIRFWLEML